MGFCFAGGKVAVSKKNMHACMNALYIYLLHVLLRAS